MGAIARYLEIWWGMAGKYRIQHDYQSCPRAAGGQNPEAITPEMRREANRLAKEIAQLRQEIIRQQAKTPSSGARLFF